MLKEHTRMIRKLAIVTDLLVVTAAFFVGHALWSAVRHNIYPLNAYLALLPLLLLIWGVLLYHFGIYDTIRVEQIPAILFALFKSSAFVFITFGTFMYLFKMTYVSRAFILFLFILTTLCISLEKVTLIVLLRFIRKKGFNYRRMLIVGTNKRAQDFMKLVMLHDEWGLKLVGFINEEKGKIGTPVGAGYAVLGGLADIPDIIHNNVIDEIVFVIPHSGLDKVQESMHFCEAEGLKIHLAVDYAELKFSKAKQTDLHGFPLLTFESTPDKMWHLLIKRFIDFVVSGLLLFVLWPFFVVIVLMIRLTSVGPAFFKQERCSLNGRRFTLFKFRTMYQDAEVRLKELRPHNEMTGPVFKMKDDPRVTPFGKFLRRTSIDELPQLWNVFKGDMSLVGPRPPIPQEVTSYDNWQRRRLSMRPGLTCLWQISGRSRINDFNQWVKLDLEYIDNWSLLLDVRILLRTVPVVLFGIGSK